MKTKSFKELTPSDKVYVCYEDGSYVGAADIIIMNEETLKFRYKSIEHVFKRSSVLYLKVSNYNQFDFCFSCENELKKFVRSKRVERLNNMISKIEQQIEDVKEFRKQNYPLFSGDYYTKKIEDLNII